MFLGSIFEMLLLAMQGTVPLIPSIIPHVMHQSVAYCKEFLAGVLELLHILPAFGVLGKLHRGLPVLCEDNDLRDL